MQSQINPSNEDLAKIMELMAHDSYLNALKSKASDILEKYTTPYFVDGELKRSFINESVQHLYEQTLLLIECRTEKYSAMLNIR